VNNIKEQSGKSTALLAGEEKRRSQRVIVRVPVTLLLSENGQAGKINCHTVAVNIHGAMVVSPRALEENSRLEIVNERTGDKIGCRVTRAARESSEGFLIPVEFITPSPNFWQITFPPANWKALD
jgi:hypothetical protein